MKEIYGSYTHSLTVNKKFILSPLFIFFHDDRYLDDILDSADIRLFFPKNDTLKFNYSSKVEQFDPIKFELFSFLLYTYF